MVMAYMYIRTYRQQAYFFITCHEPSEYENFAAFSWLSTCWCKPKQNKKKILSRLDFALFQICGFCSPRHEISSDYLVPLDRRSVGMKISWKYFAGIFLARNNASLARPATRQSHELNYKQIRPNKYCYKYSLYPRTIPLWNKLPPAGKSAPNLDSFKRLLENGEPIANN